MVVRVRSVRGKDWRGGGGEREGEGAYVTTVREESKQLGSEGYSKQGASPSEREVGRG